MRRAAFFIFGLFLTNYLLLAMEHIFCAPMREIVCEMKIHCREDGKHTHLGWVYNIVAALQQTNNP